MSCPNATVTPAQDQINRAIRSGDNGEAIRLLEADETLIRACGRDGATPLHAAAEETNEEMVAWLPARHRNLRFGRRVGAILVAGQPGDRVLWWQVLEEGEDHRRASCPRPRPCS